MPELPEVETTLRGIAPHLVGQTINKVAVRQWQLRWPIHKDLPRILQEQKVLAARRRGKYLIFQCSGGELILHLGMSGVLRWLPKMQPAQKHDHVDIIFNNQQVLRFTDPRRFGALIWTEEEAQQHALIKNMGPEPLSEQFDGDYLFQRSRKRTQAVKNFIMDGRIVVGVGNIYANEALFLAGLRPTKRAGKVTRQQFQVLAANIKSVLQQAIEVGGTTLRDFVGGDGKPGYFKQQLLTYGRAGQSCLRCRSTLKLVRVGQRASVYCPQCQH